MWGLNKAWKKWFPEGWLQGGLHTPRHEQKTLSVDVFRDMKGVAEMRVGVSVSWEKGSRGKSSSEDEESWES